MQYYTKLTHLTNNLYQVYLIYIEYYCKMKLPVVINGLQ